jgi:hypothetical protein
MSRAQDKMTQLDAGAFSAPDPLVSTCQLQLLPFQGTSQRDLEMAECFRERIQGIAPL